MSERTIVFDIPIEVTFTVERREGAPELLLQSTMLELGPRAVDGNAVIAVALPWRKILAEVKRDPGFLPHFAKHPRAFEEFLAGVFQEHGFDEVILTPRSGDLGRDLIAIKNGLCSVRILGQAKAYSPGNLVNHDDCRALLGVIGGDHNASKGIIITTSDFAPGIEADPIIAPHLPHRLQLVNGLQLPNWLAGIPPHLPSAARE